MNHRITRNEFLSFEKDLFTESETEYGTWSYVSCKRIELIIPRFRKIEAEIFIKDIIENLTKLETKILTKYKLVQLLSIIFTKKLPQFEEVFINNKQILYDFLKKLENGPLSEAIIVYIKSFYN